MERPRISIRFRIIISFLLAFFFLLAIATGSMYFISRLDSRYTFFDEAGNFAFEIQQARRCEKNFFLYGAKSDLYDALSYIGNAAHIIETSNEIRSVNHKMIRAFSDNRCPVLFRCFFPLFRASDAKQAAYPGYDTSCGRRSGILPPRYPSVWLRSSETVWRC